MIISVFDRVENIVGKGEIACTSNFSFFPKRFQKASFQDPSKGVIVLELVNPFPHNDTFWRPWETSLWKHWEKEKLLVRSIFSFSNIVFYSFQ